MKRLVMTGEEILECLNSGLYTIDPIAGILSGSRGDIRPFVGNKEGHLFVRLYTPGKVKTIALARLIWMSQTGQTIPPGFEIHHQNENTKDNSWENLICLHQKDHQKMHRNRFEEPVPF